MTIDRYTRGVLTIIAISLAAIAARMWTSDAHAQRGASCGDITPCLVEVRKPILVIQNGAVEVFGTVTTVAK